MRLSVCRDLLYLIEGRVESIEISIDKDVRVVLGFQFAVHDSGPDPLKRKNLEYALGGIEFVRRNHEF